MRVTTFLITRYIVFGLFTIFNAITCSAAAWNLGLVHSTKPLQVDLYLIFLGAFSLLSIITLIFVELLSTKPLTTRVWFECAWVALFWVMQLAGGAALIPIESGLSCSNNTTEFVAALCTSERVLLALTWMCAIMLLIYLLVLVFIAASRYHGDLKIWVSDVRTLQVSTAKQTSATAYTPVVRTKQRADTNVYARRPPRSKPTQVAQHYGGLSSKYNVEPFRPLFAAPEHSNLPEATPLPLVVVPVIPPSKPFPVPPQDGVNTLSASLGLYDVPRERQYVPSSPHPAPSPALHMPLKQSISLPTPPPLGNWPRQDIMKQPVKPRKHKLPSAYEFPGSHVGGSDVPDVSAQPRPRRPSGPRFRLPSGENGHRLGVLDLYPGVSASYIRDEVAR